MATLSLLAVPMVAVIFVSALSIQKPTDWSQDRLMLSTVINLERLETINGNLEKIETVSGFGQRPLR